MGDDDRDTTGWTDGGRDGCNCPDCRPCSDERCMEARRREHARKVARLDRAREE